MALSEQSAPIRNLVVFKKYAKAQGARVSESLPEDAPNPGVHDPKSWHYDRATYLGVTHNKAADINYGPAGAPASERVVIKHLIVVAQSMGLAVIYALYGTDGPAARHKDHLHVDVGSYTNLGNGGRAVTPGDLVVWDTQPLIRARQDNLAGADVKKRLTAIRESSVLGGRDFPWGIKYTQSVIGAKQTGKWDAQSLVAHDKVVKNLETLWKKQGLFSGTVDTKWDANTDKALSRFMARYA